MTIDGNYYTEPEAQAYIKELEAREKEYKRLLKQGLQDIIYLMRYHDVCEVCALMDDEGICHSDDDDCDKNYKWRYEAEVEKLIGGEDSDKS